MDKSVIENYTFTDGSINKAEPVIDGSINLVINEYGFKVNLELEDVKTLNDCMFPKANKKLEYPTEIVEAKGMWVVIGSSSGHLMTKVVEAQTKHTARSIMFNYMLDLDVKSVNPHVVSIFDLNDKVLHRLI